MRVLLVNMPYINALCPSFALSLLKPLVRQRGFDCKVVYPNLWLADLDPQGYQKLAAAPLYGSLVGDWLFAQWGLPERIRDNQVQRYLSSIRKSPGGDAFCSTLSAIMQKIGPFVESSLERMELSKWDVIGFTLLFQQTLASVLMAREIKKRYPEKLTVLGGPCCQGAMGMQLHRLYPWVDYVFTGEADSAFPEFLEKLAQGKPYTDVPGLVYRSVDESVLTSPPEPFRDLDSLPYPDYSDYFSTISPKSALEFSVKRPIIFFESSRGCWWGQKHQCKFCGLNGLDAQVRNKSPERVLAEIEHLSARYPARHLQAADNVMPHHFFKSVLPGLKERKPKLPAQLMYEQRANLKPGQIRLLAEAGVSMIQIGVESLSNRLLEAMSKGVTVIQIIQTLKWCAEYGMRTHWNILYGFPEENAADYEQIVKTAAAISHLQPPTAVGQVRVDRFSPYYKEWQKFGFRDLRVPAIYSFVYTEPEERLRDVVPGFIGSFPDREPASFAADIRALWEDWKKQTARLIKCAGVSPELLIVDRRLRRGEALHVLNGWRRRVYEFCDVIRGKQEILHFARPVDSGELEDWLAEMEEEELIYREGKRYLTLALSGAWAN